MKKDTIPAAPSEPAVPSTAHTPGEWKSAEDEPFVYALNDGGTNRMWLSVQPGDVRRGGERVRTADDELRANAKLIAAAPELLAALKGTLYLFEDRAVTKTDIEQIAFARAAIRKATS